MKKLVGAMLCAVMLFSMLAIGAGAESPVTVTIFHHMGEQAKRE